MDLAAATLALTGAFTDAAQHGPALQIGLLAMAVLGFGWGIFRIARVVWTHPRYLLEENRDFMEILRDLGMDGESRSIGYEILELPANSDAVIRSRAVDQMLRNVAIALQENRVSIRRHRDALVQRADTLEIVLRTQYWRSRHSEPRKLFVNEPKLCLVSDLIPGRHCAETRRGSYFETYVTNETFDQRLVSDDARPQVVWKGCESPGILEKGELRSIRDSLAANGIGMSTLAHTEDGYLIFWRQSGRAQHAVDQFAPTGSGSCDFSDWHEGDSLQATLQRGMERELSEESNFAEHGLRLQEVEDTRVIGYYRPIRRAGKPEFVGVSKVRIRKGTLSPNVAEVDSPEESDLSWPARTLHEFRHVLETEVANARLSVPLRMTLLCLREAMDEEPGRWTAFFRVA